ncbi:hypothetical protein [Nitrosomonas sp. Nm34]|nr:hypothetical protein [Nitrosomonas sp. Nm34]SFI93867.1 hypothetical protein SAMN05428978_10628 [Nitrosomonas sp. Nm34]
MRLKDEEIMAMALTLEFKVKASKRNLCPCYGRQAVREVAQTDSVLGQAV